MVETAAGFCSACGAGLPAGAQFCGSCGTRRGRRPSPAATLTATATTDGLVGVSPTNVKVVYVLYLAGLLFGITLLVGVVMAYVNRASAPEWLRTHYQFQIRTFWIGLLYTAVSIILVLAIVGIFMLIFVLAWYLVRCIKGLQAASAGRPVAKPTSWMFG